MAVRQKMEAIMFAKIYNNLTGAGISHKDVEEMGFIESCEVEHAMKFVGKM